MITPLERYLEVYDDEAGAVLVRLDAAIRAAAPALEPAITYRLLSHAVARDWRHWVCAVNATTSAVGRHVREALDRSDHCLVDAEEISAVARTPYGKG